MKQGRPLPELAAELERQANAKQDYLAEAEAMCLRSNGVSRLVLDEAGQDYQLAEIAHGQIADYLGIPKAFYDRLRGETSTLRIPVDGVNGHDDLRGSYEEPDTPLFDVMVNTLMMGKGTERRLVRTLDGKARAFLSDSFNPDIDNIDVFTVVARILLEAGLSPETVVSCEVTERRLYLKVISPALEAIIRLGNGNGYLKEPQVVRAGFVLMNSEVGLGSLIVQQYVCVLVCTNGLIREDAYRQRHLGKTLQSDEDGGIYRSDTRVADARARLLKLRDHIADALDETRFREFTARMQESTEVRITGSVEKGVEATARRFGLIQHEKDAVLRNLIEGADLSMWGLSNAVTAAASTLKDYDRATELEAIGGRILSLTPSEARDILAA
ncbi:MAG TPA: DUF932 domain-containing protein [Armatimonadota bacterium]|jgi:hypothetical protein